MRLEQFVEFLIWFDSHGTTPCDCGHSWSVHGFDWGCEHKNSQGRADCTCSRNDLEEV